MDFKDNVHRELYLCYKFFMDAYSKEEQSFGLVPDSFPSKWQNTSSIAGTGYLFSALVVGVDFGYISKEEANKIAIKAARTMRKLESYHGWFYHFYEIDTGEPTIHSEISTIDTALMVAGLLTAGSFFGGEVLEIARFILNRMNYQYFLLQYGHMLSMSMNYQFNFQGHWDRYAEQLILYILGAAISNPEHCIDKEIYYNFIRDYGSYKNHNFIYSWHGSLFTYQYSQAYIDFRNYVDRDGVNWFNNSLEATKAAYEYAVDSEGEFKSFHRLSWGLTACANKGGYSGRYGSPPCGERKIYNDGTLAPCGAIGAIVFTPKESIDALNYFYTKNELTSDYGLLDSYNEDKDYFCPYYLSIDKGISMVMISNYLKETIWRYFMCLDEIQKALSKLEFKEVK